MQLETRFSPHAVTVAYLEQSRLRGLLVAGIVNPFGPTLTLAAEARDATPGPARLVYATLNPFHSQVWIVGHLYEAGEGDEFPDQLLQALKPLHPFPAGAPTLCLATGAFAPTVLRYLYTNLLRTAPGLDELTERLLRYPGDPWGRVSEEVGEAASAAADAMKHRQEMALPDVGRTQQRLGEFLDIVLEPRHNVQELKAFLYAWEGSIDYQAKAGNRHVAESALSLKRFSALLSRLLAGGGEATEPGRPPH